MLGMATPAQSTENTSCDVAGDVGINLLTLYFEDFVKMVVSSTLKCCCKITAAW